MWLIATTQSMLSRQPNHRLCEETAKMRFNLLEITHGSPTLRYISTCGTFIYADLAIIPSFLVIAAYSIWNRVACSADFGH